MAEKIDIKQLNAAAAALAQRKSKLDAELKKVEQEVQLAEARGKALDKVPD